MMAVVDLQQRKPTCALKHQTSFSLLGKRLTAAGCSKLVAWTRPAPSSRGHRHPSARSPGLSSRAIGAPTGRQHSDEALSSVSHAKSYDVQCSE